MKRGEIVVLTRGEVEPEIVDIIVANEDVSLDEELSAFLTAHPCEKRKSGRWAGTDLFKPEGFLAYLIEGGKVSLQPYREVSLGAYSRGPKGPLEKA